MHPWRFGMWTGAGISLYWNVYIGERSGLDGSERLPWEVWMQFDLHEIPFSAYGSYFAISYGGRYVPERKGLHLRTLNGGAYGQEYYRMELVTGDQTVDFEEEATPTLLRLSCTQGYVEFCMPEPDVLRMRGKGVALRLTRDGMSDYEYAVPVQDGLVEINGRVNRLMMVPLAGRLTAQAPWEEFGCSGVSVQFSPGDDGDWQGAVVRFKNAWKDRRWDRSFEDCHRDVQAQYALWDSHVTEVPRYAQARDRAAYINWSAFVQPEGHIRRPAMLMSKNWMLSVWSWDHCFNAMALAKGDPDAAWDQFLVMLDHQDAEGALPDCINDRTMIWNFVKPPIHGWALDWMMEHSSAISPERLSQVYQPLCRWTDWWFTYMDSDRDGIPQYFHGNDSGWDNGTAFRRGTPLETPDLSAFLVLQMEALAKVAQKLDKKEDAAEWFNRSRHLLDAMLEHFWVNGRLVARLSGGHEVVQCDSLQMYLPILLGQRLPQEVRDWLVKGLQPDGKFLTAHGLATESPESPFYREDGYWRGPIWAPPTLMVVQGLAHAGEMELARDIACRFCELVTANGMAENFDPFTGKGLRDLAYTWTSSVFLLLAGEYAR